MHIPIWFWMAVIVLLTWGIAGLFQKLATNHLSAESTTVCLVIGFFLLCPWLYPQESLRTYSARALLFSLLSALLNALGAWAMLKAMRHGGKASIVVPLTALYPVVTVFLSPAVLHEPVSLAQAAGVACGLIAVVLLST